LLALALRGDILASTGRAESAVSYTSEALAMTTAGNESLMIYWEFVLLRHVTALLRAARFEEFQEAVRSYALTSPRSLVYFGGVLDFARGVLQLHNGRWDSAADSLTSALIAFRVHQVSGLIPLAAGMASLCGAITGSAGQEPAVPAPLPLDAGQLQLLGAGYAAAASAVRNPGNQKDLADLASLAERAQDASMLAVEFELRLLSLRAGDLENLGRMEQLSASMEGPVAAQAHAFAAACLAGDGPTLLRLATADGPGGIFSLQRQCTAVAVRLAITSGDEELLQRARQLAAGPGPSTLDKRTSKAQGLTRREQEIAALVAQGKRNADIAKELSLSTRTVEGHIYRIFDKLGVRHRSDLQPALRKQENRP
jgi:DNA-binding CsgD family transcriptional regulator